MNICSNVFYFCDAQLYFQHHYSSLQCHMIFRNHSNILICCSTNISDYYQCWKHLIFLQKLWYILFFRIHRWIESSKEQHLFEIEIFCNIINVFNVTFDWFITYLTDCNFRSVEHVIRMQTLCISLYGNRSMVSALKSDCSSARPVELLRNHHQSITYTERSYSAINITYYHVHI